MFFLRTSSLGLSQGSNEFAAKNEFAGGALDPRHKGEDDVTTTI